MTRRMEIPRAFFVCVITASLSSLAAEQAPGNIYVTKAHYEHTMQETGQPLKIIETGTYNIASDGRYRIDRRSSDASTFELFDPVRRTRTVVNPEQQRAFVHNSSVPWISARAGQMPRSIPGLDPDKLNSLIEESLPEMRIIGNMGLSPNQESLGTRTIGILEIEGFRYAETMANGTEVSIELWFYFPESSAVLSPGSRPIAPMQLELRSVLPGLVEENDSRRLQLTTFPTKCS